MQKTRWTVFFFKFTFIDSCYWYTTCNLSTSRSESGNLLYLPGGESPYMQYRESLSNPIAVSSNLTLKFRVRQCDKSIQTEPIRSPVKRRILSEQDRLYYSPNATEEANVNEIDEMEKDFFDLKQGGWDQSTMLLRTDRKRYCCVVTLIHLNLLLQS